MCSQSPISKEFLGLLACPACDDRPPLVVTEDNKGLRCKACGRVYPITESGIPQLTVEAATDAKSD